jgi:hypothetical protein
MFPPARAPRRANDDGGLSFRDARHALAVAASLRVLHCTDGVLPFDMFQFFIPLFGLSVVALYIGTMRSYLVLLHPEPLESWSANTVAEAATLLATLTLGVCSYARTVLTPPGFVNDPDVRAWLRRHVAEAASASTQCKHCGDKPVRAYHCRHTGRCVLRLDHFCMFSNCAIGAGNHKYFLLWQFYQLLTSAQLARLNFEAVAAGPYSVHPLMTRLATYIYEDMWLCSCTQA